MIARLLATLSLSSRLRWVCVAVAMMTCASGQTALVDLPDEPPANHLYRASERHRFFDSPQANQLSEELVKLEREIGFAIYLVTVHSPEQSVLDHLRQQIKLKWSNHRDCLVIFYDFDTRLLALQYESVFFDREGMVENSRFSVGQQQTWVGFVDRWLSGRQQLQGLDVDQLPALVLDLASLLRSQSQVTEQQPSYFWGFVAGFIGLTLLGFIGVDRLSRKQVRRVCYVYPTVAMNYRLKARYGGGLIAAHDFGGAPTQQQSRGEP